MDEQRDRRRERRDGARERTCEYDVSGRDGRFVIIPVSVPGPRDVTAGWGIFDCAFKELVAVGQRKESLPTFDDLEEDLTDALGRAVEAAT